MLFAIKLKDGTYLGGKGCNTKNLWQARIYSSYEMARRMRDASGLIEDEPTIITVEIYEGHPYNPDLEL